MKNFGKNQIHPGKSGEPMSKELIKEDLFWKGKRVLITGHTGFKGSWLTLLLLAKGANIYGYSLQPKEDLCLFNLNELDKNKPKEFHGEFNSCIGNINDYGALNKFINLSKPEIIFHLAAQPLVKESYFDPINTWKTNVMGSLNILEIIRRSSHYCSLIMITTDKVYKNKNWHYAYRECDELGDVDPYSSSKAAMEIAISSWRQSFCGDLTYQNSKFCIASARSGNVIGGGDWSKNRIIPDAINALKNNKPIVIRNPNSTRPWQHVLEPLAGYIQLAKLLHTNLINNENNKKNPFADAFNFGPSYGGNKKVTDLINEVFKTWEGKTIHKTDHNAHEEAFLLNLVSDKARCLLNWESKWNFEETVSHTINWYKNFYEGKNSIDCCIKDIENYSFI